MKRYCELGFYCLYICLFFLGTLPKNTLHSFFYPEYDILQSHIFLYQEYDIQNGSCVLRTGCYSTSIFAFVIGYENYYNFFKIFGAESDCLISIEDADLFINFQPKNENVAAIFTGDVSKLGLPLENTSDELTYDEIMNLIENELLKDDDMDNNKNHYFDKNVNITEKVE